MACTARGSLSTDDPIRRQFIDSVRERFEQAVDRVGVVELDYRIAGRAVRLRFAGPALVSRLTRALTHLAAPEPTDPDIEVRVWESESTGITMPPPPWSWDSYRARGDIAGFDRNGVHVSFHPGASALNVFDAATRTACFWMPTARGIPAYEAAAPFRVLFHWWFASVGLQLVHGAAVGTRVGGIVLAGDGGAGKSSTALLCVKQGWSFVGDDYCVVEIGDDVVAHSLYNSAKADGAALRRIGDIAPSERGASPRADGEKSTLFLWPEHGEQIVASLPIRAILLPHVGNGSRSSLHPASSRSALRSLAPSTMRQLPGAGNDTWSTLVALVRAVPAYHLELGRDVAALPDAMSAVLTDDGAIA